MKRIILLSLGLIGAGCASIPESNITGDIVPHDKKPPAIRASGPASFLRSYDIKQDYMTAAVSFSRAPLFAVLNEVLPNHSITPLDTQVDLNTLVSVSVEPMPLEDFLETLTNITNLSFEREGNQIKVAAFISKQWLLPAFTSDAQMKAQVSGQANDSGTSGGSSSGGSGGSRGTQITTNREVDEWDALIETAELFADQVVAVKTQGLIKATGRPLAMAELDRTFRDLQKTSQTVIALDVSTFEVRLNDRRQRGVDWGSVFESTLSGNPLLGALGAGLSFEPSGDVAGLNINLQGVISDSPTEVMLNILGQYGKVELNQQPKVMTLNGKTAFIGSGDEFGFVSEIRSTVTTNVATIEPTFERVLVGIELSITPMLLDDGRIMVEVTPIVSNFQGFDNFTIGGNSSSQPRIALQQLSTTTIARPGEPIQIGGLIKSRIASELNNIPLGQKESLGMLGYLLESRAEELERSELVIMITPKIVGA